MWAWRKQSFQDKRVTKLELGHKGNLRAFFIHELNIGGLLSADDEPLAHPVAYYTLNSIPQP
jgi:hypothetical protein